MATYVLPQTQVFQEFEIATSADVRTLNAHITAPHAQLVRFDEADEKEDGLLGYYQPSVETCYDWPNREAGGLIDQSYTKLWMENALLRYFQDFVSEGDAITRVSANRVAAATLAFKENGDSYPRSAEFLDRDVKLGDTVKVRSGSNTLWTYVRGFAYETVAAVVAAATADTDNHTAQSASTSYFKVSGPENCLFMIDANGSLYDGLADGDIDETYTIEVTQASTGGDLTTAKLKVTSASGHDDVAEVTPSANNVATAIGTRGLTGTWKTHDTASCSTTAEADEVSADDFVVGQKWQVRVRQDFTPPTATSGGDYDGTADDQYIATVTRGGLYSDPEPPQITISTTNGLDISGPTDVDAASVFVDVGTHGVLIKFNQTALCKGDRYYINCTASADGRASTLILAHNLPDAIVDGTQVDLSLYIKKTIQVDENRIGFAPQTNFTQSETEICVADGMIAYDSSWTDSGVEQPLDVVSEESKGYGKLYVEYRAWLCTKGDDIYSCTASDLDTAISGALDPDNPLKWAVFKAASNSGSTEVRFTAVCNPDDPDSWADVLAILDGRIEVYGLVPCTTNQTVLDLYKAHILEQSTPENARWRVGWFPLENTATSTLVSSDTSEDGEEVLAKITDDPDTSGTQYTLVTVPAGNGNFVTNGVAAGDILRYAYTTDGFGNESYSTLVIDDVVNEDVVRLRTGAAAAINVAAKIEVWRNLTADAQAAALGAKAASYACRRVMAVWPDQASSSGTVSPGYAVCAALAGLASGVVPQQGLTRVALSGFDDVSRTTRLFNRTQLNTMAGLGVLIVTRDPLNEQIYTRHAVTTGAYDDINAREEMVTRNVDSISYLFMERFEPYIGKSNVTPGTLDIIEAETLATIQYLRSNNFVPRLGGQLIDGTITTLRQSPVFLDQVILVLDLTIPYPLNNLLVHLVI